MLKSEGTEKRMEVRKVEGKTLREVMVKIRLERVDTQEGITVEVLLDSRATGLVMSSEFMKKQGFKEVRKANECEECRWVTKQGRTHRAYCGSEHLLSGT